jgi:3-hydroxyisobutyrate dehydrogenase
MGYAMAGRLSSTYDVIGYDVVDEQVDHARQYITPAPSAAEAAAPAQVVVVSVRDAVQLNQVVESVRWTMTPGSALIVTSTVGAPVVRAVESSLADRSVHLIDAPVSGGPVRASNGDLLVMVGASDDALAVGSDVLDALASTIVVAGPVGSGQDLRTINQLLCGIHTAAAAEALALAHALELDLDQVVAVLGTGSAASFMLSDRGPRIAQQLLGEEPAVRSRLDLIAADMGLVGDLTRQFHLATPVAAAAEQLFRMGVAVGLESEDDSVIAALMG